MKQNATSILLELDTARLKLNPTAMVGIDAVVELGFRHCIAFEVDLSLSSCLMKRAFCQLKKSVETSIRTGWSSRFRFSLIRHDTGGLQPELESAA